MSANASGIDLDKLGMSAVPETSGEEARLAKGCVRRHVSSGDQRHELYQMLGLDIAPGPAEQRGPMIAPSLRWKRATSRKGKSR